MVDLTFNHHDAHQALAMADHLSAAYEEAYLGTPQEHDPFYSAARFSERFTGYTSAPGFELVTAHDGDELAGYIFGYALPGTSRWWHGLIDPVSDGFTAESGDRTFAINELHVRARWRGHGVASRLHQELLNHRPEKRVTILVRRDNPARATYIHWGYRVAGRLKPYPDSPVYDALILDMRTATLAG